MKLPEALDGGISPIMAKEIVYQAVDYLGIGRVRPFLNITNEVLTERGVALPLPGQATTTMEKRLEKGGLTLSQRELITFCFLAAQGGCEPQLTAHAKGNMNLGNDQAFLIRVVSIGYPRSLNAITCVKKAAE